MRVLGKLYGMIWEWRVENPEGISGVMFDTSRQLAFRLLGMLPITSRFGKALVRFSPTTDIDTHSCAIYFLHFIVT